MTTEPAPGAAAVRTALRSAGIAIDVREFAHSTRTSAEAAAAIGCEVAQIAKTLVFERRADGAAVLVIASGADRVDTDALAAAVGGKVRRPDAAYVRARTGYSIGGVPPVGHAGAIDTVVDRRMLELPLVWASAGTAHSVFAVAPATLVELTAARVEAVTG